ncbi:hypothetical protein [Frigoriglobus tundricola]|uniref:Uncharacterized protein n=1 Tax=Frigoriglobus tundricola TaxID=2774151 RepID=A0A6M5YJW0_9BACT|nr:hypothetical protein [Frigoriglobus tundricola]QJW93566.1 hypothetical protein FTUN_1073 [Frigoriglobus tundricola]
MPAYLIEFDTLSGHSPGTGATLTPPVLDLVGWRSIGNAQGGRFINMTGGPIRAIYLKSNSAASALQVTPASGGRLFNTVWVKPDGAGGVAESYFMDGNVPTFGAFWMRVPPNTPVEIQECDAGQACPFSGQVFAQNPAAPTGPGWTQIRSPQPSPTPLWRDLLSATPSEYRVIDSYGETPDGQHVLFLSQGAVLLYDHQKKTVSLVTPPKVGTAPPVNAVRFDPAPGEFQLLYNGHVVNRVGLGAAVTSELGRSV